MAESTRTDTSIVRSFAIIAIVNSHMEKYYPRPEFAIGGLIGLALFFMATGMGLNESRHTRSLSFPNWYGKRILRIHPSIVSSVILVQLVLFGEWRSWSWGDYLDNCVYPLSTYHFLNKIFVYYVPLYFYVRWTWSRKHQLGLAVCSLLCVSTAMPDVLEQWRSSEPLKTGFLNEAFLWSVFFSMTLIGVWISDSKWLFRKREIWRLFASSAILGVLYLVLKFVMAKLGIFTEGFLLLYLVGIGLSISLIVLLAEERLLQFCRDSHWLITWSTVGLGAISLEIYLVHTQFYIHGIGLAYRFPWSFVWYCGVTILGAVVVHRCARHIRDIVARRLPK